ncbi:unnamed protein product [Haemonchus placei]|uniref:Uncharacterized protein n=1 Tax=Haemonchus placei TaxID=6290 RepID=A0A0N4WDD0_HAEPC|nr:unnamed protein product [Haemonchus placei]
MPTILGTLADIRKLEVVNYRCGWLLQWYSRSLRRFAKILYEPNSPFCAHDNTL